MRTLRSCDGLADFISDRRRRQVKEAQARGRLMADSKHILPDAPGVNVRPDRGEPTGRPEGYFVLSIVGR
jgi:hypothetical protein